MKRKNWWTIFFGVLLIVVGFIALLDSLRLAHFWPVLGRLWPLILIAFGLWLLVRRRHFSWDEKTEIREGKKYSKAFGDLKIDTTGMDPHGLDVEMGFGDLEVNLTKASFSDREHTVHLALGFGDMKVWIPSDIRASLSASCGAGKIDLLGKIDDGLGNKVDHQDDGYDSAQNKLKTFAKLGFGDMRISRV
ncbi:MAG: cell wall-active antibiotics response protein LiaF [Candidatus Zixiibacteriota bacterium]